MAAAIDMLQQPATAPASDVAVPVVSPFWFRQFVNYTRWYLRKHFRQVLVDRSKLSSIAPDEPVVFCMNHPCWWDPLMGLLLAGSCFPERTHFAAMDADALESYSIFKKLGFFGVERGTGRGAVRFLRMAEAITARPATALWVTPQGRYADVRERPVQMLHGLSHVVSRLGQGTIVPIALEYTFWDERLPVALAAFGTPIPLGHRHQSGVSCESSMDAADGNHSGAARAAHAWDAILSDALGETQDRLAERVMARDPSVFDVLVDGRQGMGNWYGWWRSLKHGWSGDPARQHRR